jgi:hypothetical protein
MKRFYALANLLVIMAVIVWNYLANALGINGNTISNLSEEYANLFTPAGYAFSIWGLIYLGLLGLGVYQVKKVFFDRDGDEAAGQMGPWLIIANLANAAWVWCWLSERTGLSVILMIVILISLIMVILRMNMERWDAPLSLIIWVWWPICLYSGWIAVATIANVAAYLSKIGWQFLFTEVTWTMIMVLLATGINLFMIITRKMPVFALVGAWALVAIAARHWDRLPLLQWTSMASALLLLIAMAIHGYRNRATGPIAKLKQGR